MLIVLAVKRESGGLLLPAMIILVGWITSETHTHQLQVVMVCMCAVGGVVMTVLAVVGFTMPSPPMRRFEDAFDEKHARDNVFIASGMSLLIGLFLLVVALIYCGFYRVLALYSRFLEVSEWHCVIAAEHLQEKMMMGPLPFTTSYVIRPVFTAPSPAEDVQGPTLFYDQQDEAKANARKKVLEFA